MELGDVWVGLGPGCLHVCRAHACASAVLIGCPSVSPPFLPPDATGPALILVGALMILNITKIPWANVQEAVPAFLTMVRSLPLGV